MIKQFSVSQVGEVLQKIYDSEIQVNIYWASRSGVDWEIHDEENNKCKTSRINASLSNPEWGKIEYSISALAYELYRMFPKSNFAKWYTTLESPVPLERI